MIRCLACALLLLAAPLAAQQRDATVPDLNQLVTRPRSELAPVLERWSADRGALGRRYGVEYSPQRRDRFRAFHAEWRRGLQALPFERLTRPAQVDWLLLDNRLRYELAQLDREESLAREMAPVLPFADSLFRLLEQRRRFERPEPAQAAQLIAAMATQAEAARKALMAGDAAAKPTRIVAYRAADVLQDLKRQFAGWLTFYSGYDAQMTWWVADPAKRFDTALDALRKALREQVVGIREGQDEPIVGDPIGASGLQADLANEMIAYTPAELITIAEQEYAMLLAEAKKASGEMGFGDDWKKAAEATKDDYAPVGTQTLAVRDMAFEAIRYVEENDLVTVPALAKEVWRMEMLSPAQQRVSPFFLGGEVVLVSSPTDGMTDDEKLMTLRANNLHGSRAVVHHELIPGHHLQGFAAQRNGASRGIFSTPFYGEGWALWWELYLWDRGFPATPKNKMGMLFWRMHRAARIIFSLKFHLGEWTPQQCIDFLVDAVGHERASATGEVRRSFNGSYSPLYQAGYLLGGMQLRALHRELVDSKRMSDRQFHDAVLEAGPMPIEMVRAQLMPERPLTRNYTAGWRFGQ